MTDSAALVSTLVKTLSVRYRSILDTSQNSTSEDVSGFTSNLTHSEQEIFRAGFRGVDDFKRWKARDFEILESYSINNKRKRIF